MNNKMNYELTKIIKQAEKEMLELRHPYVGSEHLLLSLLSIDSINEITSKYNLTYDNFRKELINIVGQANKKSKVILYTPLLRGIISEFMETDNKNEYKLLEILLTNDDGIAVRILDTMDIDILAILDELKEPKKGFLSELGINLNEENHDELIGREKEIKLIEEILLRKNKNNPILIGEAGVGKSAIVGELARRIKNKEVPEYLQKYKIINIDMSSMLANTKYRGEFETKLNNIIREIKKNKNIILFIDEIHTIVKSGGGEGSIDAANILKPYLASNEIKLIGATTIDEYEKFISKDKALERRFQKVFIKEPNINETIDILKGIKHEYEKYYQILIDDNDLVNIVKLTDKYIHSNHNPDKSIEVLDSLLSKIIIENNNQELIEAYLDKNDYKNALKLRKKNMNHKIHIKYSDIKEIIERIGNTKIIDETLLNNLKKYLINNTYNYNVIDLIEILKKDGIKGILFKGNKDLGKSYTAKLISDYLGYNFISLNGLEYTSSMSINKLIGSTVGYVGYEDTCLFDKIKYNPYSLILIKNIDCVNPTILELIKNIINDGFVNTNHGDTINFNSCIIIMTSNKTSYQLGYNNKEEKSIIDNVINFNMLDHKMINKYLKNNNLTLDSKQIKKEITFKELSKYVNDSIDKYNYSMI